MFSRTHHQIRSDLINDGLYAICLRGAIEILYILWSDNLRFLNGKTTNWRKESILLMRKRNENFYQLQPIHTIYFRINIIFIKMMTRSNCEWDFHMLTETNRRRCVVFNFLFLQNIFKFLLYDQCIFLTLFLINIVCLMSNKLIIKL